MTDDTTAVVRLQQLAAEKLDARAEQIDGDGNDYLLGFADGLATYRELICNAREGRNND